MNAGVIAQVTILPCESEAMPGLSALGRKPTFFSLPESQKPPIHGAWDGVLFKFQR
jgi:hypothetical protein